MGKLLSVSTRATAASTLEDTVETTLCTTPATAPVMTAAFAEKPEATLLAMFPPAAVPADPNSLKSDDSALPAEDRTPPPMVAIFATKRPVALSPAPSLSASVPALPPSFPSADTGAEVALASRFCAEASLDSAAWARSDAVCALSFAVTRLLSALSARADAGPYLATASLYLTWAASADNEADFEVAIAERSSSVADLTLFWSPSTAFALAAPEKAEENAAPVALPVAENLPVAPESAEETLATRPLPPDLPAAAEKTLPKRDPEEDPAPDRSLSTWEAKPAMDGMTFTDTDPTSVDMAPPYTSIPNDEDISYFAASAESLRRSFLARSPGDKIRCGVLTRFLASSVNP